MSRSLSAGVCWVCGSPDVRLLWIGTCSPASPDAVRVTDTSYGATGDLFECNRCGFRQCPTSLGLTALYEEMDDPAYEATRSERALQARRLLHQLAPFPKDARLLDVGAGSGILVEVAIQMGLRAEGIEPSGAFQRRALIRGLPIQRGTLPHEEIRGPFDIVTLVDVIEHVSDPRTLLRAAADLTAVGGRVAIVTPDVRSFAARALGRKWWHYRPAHVGYFDRSTLEMLVRSVGLAPERICRPGWYFPADYLVTRLLTYAPRRLRIAPPRWMARIIVPFNLFDSTMMICRRI